MKIIRKVLAVLLIIGMLAGCNKEQKKDRIVITTTIYPIYDWVCNIVEDNVNVEVRYLLDKGSDLHSFQPSSNDIMNIIGSDLFIYVGGESDEWVSDVLGSKDASKVSTMNLLEALGNRALKEEDEDEYDEHIWLSLENASILCEQIAEKIIEIDPENEEEYRTNLEEYGHELWLLTRQYRDAFSGDGQKVMVVADRFPFAYLVNDYGIEYYAAFSGCSAESEASFETVVFLAQQVDRYRLKSIVHIESSDGSIAETVKGATESKDQQIIMLDSLQTVGADKIEKGISYLEIMRQNLEVLQQAIQTRE